MEGGPPFWSVVLRAITFGTDGVTHHLFHHHSNQHWPREDGIEMNKTQSQPRGWYRNEQDPVTAQTGGGIMHLLSLKSMVENKTNKRKNQ